MMQNLVQKALNLNNVHKAVSYVTISPNAPVPLLAVPAKQEFALDNPKEYNTIKSMRSVLPVGSGILRAVSGVTVKAQVRYAHSDVQLPNMSKMRRSSTKDTSKPARETAASRKAFTYLATNASLLLGVYGAKTVAVKSLMLFWYNQDVCSQGVAEVDLSKIPEGKSITYKWQGKPLFIKHRTEEEIEAVRSVDVAQMRDPQRDEDRVKDPKWLICLGICTHLGCVPIANKGDNVGGYFCPCHGSHYDASGRVTGGPAPSNLEVPEYSFSGPTTALVG